jgi:hypothetical protein
LAGVADVAPSVLARPAQVHPCIPLPASLTRALEQTASERAHGKQPAQQSEPESVDALRDSPLSSVQPRQQAERLERGLRSRLRGCRSPGWFRGTSRAPDLVDTQRRPRRLAPGAARLRSHRLACPVRAVPGQIHYGVQRSAVRFHNCTPRTSANWSRRRSIARIRAPRRRHRDRARQLRFRRSAREYTDLVCGRRYAAWRTLWGRCQETRAV